MELDFKATNYIPDIKTTLELAVKEARRAWKRYYTPVIATQTDFEDMLERATGYPYTTATEPFWEVWDAFMIQKLTRCVATRTETTIIVLNPVRNGLQYATVWQMPDGLTMMYDPDYGGHPTEQSGHTTPQSLWDALYSDLVSSASSKL